MKGQDWVSTKPNIVQEVGKPYYLPFEISEGQRNSHNKDLCWFVYANRRNPDTIEVVNIFDYPGFYQSLCKCAKKYPDDKSRFIEKVRSNLFYYFCCKAEWEILLSPIFSHAESQLKVDVYSQVMLNFTLFSEYIWNNAFVLRCENRERSKHTMNDWITPERNLFSEWRIAVYILADPNSEVYCESAQKAYYRALEKARGVQSDPVFYVDEITEEDSEHEHRPEFEHLVEDCRQGQFDLIVMDSVSCCLSHICTDKFQLVTELKHLPHPVGFFFERESISTLHPNSIEMLDVLCFVYSNMNEQNKNKKRVEGRIKRVLRGENVLETYVEEDE